jgi:hypothetical protein
MADNVKKALNETGKNEVEILKEVNAEIDKKDIYKKEDIEKFGRFKEKIEVDVDVKLKFKPPDDRNEFIKKYIEALKKVKEEQLARRGSKSVSPWSEAEAYEKALEAYEKMYGKNLRIPDYEFLISETQKELKILQDTGDEFDRQAAFGARIYEYQQKINDLKQRALDFDKETSKLSLEQIINVWEKKKANINSDYGDKELEAKKELDAGIISPEQFDNRKKVLGKNKQFELADLQKEAAKEVLNSFNSSISAVQSITSILGLGADSFVGKFLAGLQQGMSLVSSIISLISSVGSIAAGMPTASGGGGIFGILASLLPFASGGPVPGSGNSDSVPAMLTPGEFVINKLRASQLGSNFLAWLNGGSTYSRLAGAYATGGFVTPIQAPAQQVIISPKYNRIPGGDIKLSYDIVTKKQNRWKT